MRQPTGAEPDPEVVRTVENELMLYRAGWEDALRTHPPCHHTHPAIAASVAEMFSGWDGAHAAHLRSVARFRAETQRKDIAA